MEYTSQTRIFDAWISAKFWKRQRGFVGIVPALCPFALITLMHITMGLVMEKTVYKHFSFRLLCLPYLRDNCPSLAPN
jgi:hypothetical protein